MPLLDELRSSLAPIGEEALRGGRYRRTRRSVRWPGIGHRTDGSPILGETETWMLGGAPVAITTLLQLIEAGVVQEAGPAAILSAPHPTGREPPRPQSR